MRDFNYYISSRNDGNLSFYAGSGDVLANRKAILDKLGFPLDDLVVMNQCHSADFLLVGKEHKGKGAFSGYDAISKVDALITKEKGIVLMAQGADCPLLGVYNEQNNVLAVIHSGWKGTKKAIIPKVLSYMSESMGCNHNYTKVVVSPFAKGCCYEVGEEFKEIFREHPQAFAIKEDKLLFDLKVIIGYQLSEFGISFENISFENNCTICGNEHFSYRKESIDAGRFGLLVWRVG